MPPVDIRFLHFLPATFQMQHPELISLGASDVNEDHQIDQNEAETAVITRDIFLSQMRTPPDFSDPRVVLEWNQMMEQVRSDPQTTERLNQMIEQIREEQNRRDHGRELQRLGSQYLEEAGRHINGIRRTELPLAALYNAPATAGVMLPQTVQLRQIDANGDRTLNQSEVENFLRQAHERERAGHTPPPPAVSTEDLSAQAIAFLSSTAQQILDDLSHLDTHTASLADQIPGRLYQLDLSAANGLTDEQRTGNNFLRILTWMRTQRGSSETLITSDQVRALLSGQALDLLPIMAVLLQIPNPPTELRELADFIQTTNPHFMVSESGLEDYLRSHSLHLGGIPSELLSQRSLQVLNTLAGEDHILSGEDIPRFRQSTIDRFRREHPDHPVPALTEIHFFPSLYEQFEETARPNEMHGRLLGEAEYIPLEPESFLSRVAVVLAYTLPAEAERILDQTRTSGALSLAYVLANGLHDEERAHASDSLPGIGNMALSALTSPGALVEGLGNLIFSSSHQFTSEIWNYQWNREWVRNHADRRHEERMNALGVLRRAVREHNLASLSEGVDYIRGHEPHGGALAEYLTQELHLPDIERIYHIENSREQEEAWLSFCRNLRNGQGLHWHGDLRSLLFSPWQTHNGPASLSIYERLAQETPNHRIYQSAMAAGRDQIGNGGSLFPAFWFRDWADSEASVDGLWDEIGATTLLIAASYGIGNLFHWMRTPGTLTDLPPESLRTAESLLSRGRYWTTRGLTAAPRFLSSLPADELRTSESLFGRSRYWSLRSLGMPFRFLFPRALVGREADLAIAEGVRLAEEGGRGGLLGFFRRQRAGLLTARFSADPNNAAGAEYLNRMITEIETRSTTSFRTLTHRANEAYRIMETNPTEAERILRAVEREARQAVRLHEVAITARMGSGVAPRGLETAAHLETAAEDILGGARRLETSDPQLSRSLTRLANSIRTFVGRSARGEIANADRLLTTEANLRFFAEEQHRRGMRGMGFILWAWLYERALSDTDRNNPPEQSLPMAGIDGAAAEGVRRRARRTRGTRSTYSGFSLGPVPSYHEAPPEVPPAPPPTPPPPPG